MPSFSHTSTGNTEPIHGPDMHLLNRNSFIKAGLTGSALPFYTALGKEPVEGKKIKRLLCVTTPLGMIPEYWTPTGSGSTYQPSKELKILDQHRNDFTVFSHLDHGKYGRGGHSGVHSFLSGIRIPDSKGFPEKNISIDMKAATYLGSQTRFPYLNYAVGTAGSKGSFNKTGVYVPPETSVEQAYKKQFLMIA